MARQEKKEDNKPSRAPEDLVGRAGYSMEEFAGLYGKSRTWAYRRMYAGDIMVIRGMGKIIVPASEVDRLQSLASVVGRATRRRRKNTEPGGATK